MIDQVEFQKLKLIVYIGFAVPVLLQQLLRAMEDPTAPRSDAVGFAVLSLIVRLVATQSSIINLWYSRRCYERSRGEMITMIFEKTLGRKIVSAPKKPQNSKSSGTDGADPSLNVKQRSRFHPMVLWSRIYQATSSLFRSRPAAKEAKEPASMGKILNLMRCASRSVSLSIFDLLNDF